MPLAQAPRACAVWGPTAITLAGIRVRHGRVPCAIAAAAASQSRARLASGWPAGCAMAWTVRWRELTTSHRPRRLPRHHARLPVLRQHPVGFCASPTRPPMRWPPAVLLAAFVGTGASFLAFATAGCQTPRPAQHCLPEQRPLLSGRPHRRHRNADLLCFVLMCLWPAQGSHGLGTTASRCVVRSDHRHPAVGRVAGCWRPETDGTRCIRCKVMLRRPDQWHAGLSP